MSSSCSHTAEADSGVIHLRAYDPTSAPKPQPDWPAEDIPREWRERIAPLDWQDQDLPYARYVHTSFRIEYRPIALRPPDLAVDVIPGPSETADAGDRVRIEIKRLVLLEPPNSGSRPIVMVAAFVPRPFTPEMGYGNYAILDPALEERLGWETEQGDASNWPYGMQWICDQTFNELTGRRVTPRLRRVSFTYLSFDLLQTEAVRYGPGDVGEPAAGRPAPRRGIRQWPPDLADLASADDWCVPHDERLAIHGRAVSPTVFDRDAPPEVAYLALAVMLCRARLLLRAINGEAQTLAREITSKGKTSLGEVRKVARLQAEAIIARDEISGVTAHRFDLPDLRGLYLDILDTRLGVPPDDRESLDSTTSSLQSFATSLTGAGLDRSQKMFGIGGIVFGLLSLAFASIAVIDFVDTPQRHWSVYRGFGGALMIGIILTLAIVGLWSVWNRIHRWWLDTRPNG